MSRLSALGVRRLRTLYDLGTPIPLTPLTVLIGRNSAGKSTFARLLPLLRQSAERKKRGPILWFDDLVDFGSLGDAVTRGESDLELILRFEDVSYQRGTVRPTFWGEGQAPNQMLIRQADVSMTLAEEPDSGGTFAKELRVDLAGSTLRLTMKSANELESLWVGARQINISDERIRVRVVQGSLLPTLNFYERRRIEGRDYWVPSRSPWRSSVSDFVLDRLHGRTSRGTAAKIASQIPLDSPSNVSAAVREIAGPGSWNALRTSLTPTSISMKRLVESLILANLDVVLERLDEIAKDAAKGVRYLKPLRATAERYYRRADLSVSEIDPEGRNLAIFLDSLSDSQLGSFRAWLSDNLDLDVETRRVGAQLVLMARTPNDSGSSNVADMGFGISQILPIAAQLWASSNGYRLPFSPTSFVVVEQPELHLHPAFQAKLGDLFAGVIRPPEASVALRQGVEPPRIVIETHSQHIVNRLGLLVEQGRLRPEDVSIVLFEADSSRIGTSTAKIATFDATGVLQNWPFGFFEPDL